MVFLGYGGGGKRATLQVFVGNDQGDPIPHIYYQACRVAGKNSTPCQEVKKEGTDVILIEMDPRTSQNSSSAMGSRGHPNTAINNLEVKRNAL